MNDQSKTVVRISGLAPYNNNNDYELIPLHQWDYVDGRGRNRGKSPLHNDWPRQPPCDADQIRAHITQGHNIGVRLRPTDLIVDYDPRNDVEAKTGMPDGAGWDAFVMEVGQEWIDSCPCVNTGGGGQHYYATKPADLRIREHHEAFGPGVEFKTRGRQVVAAGSKHPSGRFYEWDDFSSPLDKAPQVDEVLLSLIGRPGAGVPSTTGGQIDNDQLARLLASLDPEAFCEHERWLELGMACYHATNGQGLEAFVEWSVEDPEYQGHEENITERWHSWAADQGGSAVTMATLTMRVREAGGDTNWLALELIPEPGDPDDAVAQDFEPPPLPEGVAPGPAGVLDRINLRNAFVMQHGQAGVYHTIPGQIPQHMRVADFNHMMSNQYIEDDEGEMVQVSRVWMGSGRRRQYLGGAALYPEGDCPEDVLNTFAGWDVEPGDGRFDMILDLVNVLAAGDTDGAKYILDWSAHMIQHPATPAEAAIMIRADKGMGKTTYGQEVLYRIVKTHGWATTQGLGGKFNAHLRDCIYLFADEAFWAGNKAEESVMKGMITSHEVSVEPKGLNQYMAPNHLHIMMAANAEWVAPASHDERRYAIFEPIDRMSASWWAAVYDQINGDGLGGFLGFLLERQLGNFHPRQIPQTTGLMRQKLASMDPLWMWWFRKLQDGTMASELTDDGSTPPLWVDGEITVSRKTLQADLAGKLGRGPGTERRVATELGHALKRFVPGLATAARGRISVKGARPGVYQLASLDECREHFERLMGGTIDWEG